MTGRSRAIRMQPGSRGRDPSAGPRFAVRSYGGHADHVGCVGAVSGELACETDGAFGAAQALSLGRAIAWRARPRLCGPHSRCGCETAFSEASCAHRAIPSSIRKSLVRRASPIPAPPLGANQTITVPVRFWRRAAVRLKSAMQSVVRHRYRRPKIATRRSASTNAGPVSGEMTYCPFGLRWSEASFTRNLLSKIPAAALRLVSVLCLSPALCRVR